MEPTQSPASPPSPPPQVRTEVIAIASGKGGTGKTIVAACLGYALVRAGHRVLMVDTDTGTDGLSLFLLGPKGMQNIRDFRQPNTFRGVLAALAAVPGQPTTAVEFEPRYIYRDRPDEKSQAHGVRYEAIISSRDAYGDTPIEGQESAVPRLDRKSFRRGVVELFDQFRSEGQYDYVIVDSRGGFSFESTDVCAAADSFIMVTDADYTSFFQDRNLMRRISAAAQEMETRSVLRAILINRAMSDEASFRNELTREFPISYTDTFTLPVDTEAMLAYKKQEVPYVVAPSSEFSAATLTAFGDMFHIVTSAWDPARVSAWNALVKEVTDAVEQRNLETARREKEQHLEAEVAARAVGSIRRWTRAVVVGCVTLVFVVATWAFAERTRALQASQYARMEAQVAAARAHELDGKLTTLQSDLRTAQQQAIAEKYTTESARREVEFTTRESERLRQAALDAQSKSEAAAKRAEELSSEAARSKQQASDAEARLKAAEDRIKALDNEIATLRGHDAGQRGGSLLNPNPRPADAPKSGK